MGFLKKSSRGEGLVDDSEGDSTKDNKEGSRLENLYMNLYMKTGRDFVHKEDLYRILEELLDILGVDDFELDKSESAAMQRAEEYKHFLNTDQSGSSHYPDLLDEEED